MIVLHHQPDCIGQLIEELVVGIGRAPLQFQHNVLFMAVDGCIKVAAGVDLVHQLSDDGCAGSALVSGIGLQDRPAVIVESRKSHHIALPVIVHFNFRVYAQQHGSHGTAIIFLHNGQAASGIIWHSGSPGGVSAGSQSGQGKGGGQSQNKRFAIDVLFHVSHLLGYFCVCAVSSVKPLRTGVCKNCSLAYRERIRRNLRKTGAARKFF